MLINKPPDSGKLTSRHPMHQDLQFFPFRPADYICCAWTAMEWVHRGNGCLVVVPGSHRDPGRLLEHEYPKWEVSLTLIFKKWNFSGRCKQSLLWNPKLWLIYASITCWNASWRHRFLPSSTNPWIWSKSNWWQVFVSIRNKKIKFLGFRKAISCHYANDDVCRYINIEGTMQEESSRELIEIAKKRLRKFGQADDVDLDFSVDSLKF